MSYLPDLHHCAYCNADLGPDNGDGICAVCADWLGIDWERDRVARHVRRAQAEAWRSEARRLRNTHDPLGVDFEQNPAGWHRKQNNETRAVMYELAAALLESRI